MIAKIPPGSNETANRFAPICRPPSSRCASFMPPISAAFLRDNGGELAANFGRQIKENPVPLAITAVGLVWLMAASNRSSRPRQSAYYGTDDYAPDDYATVASCARMKVFYHKVDGANIGDDMNAVLWHKLVPGLDELASAQWLVGAGTIIDARLDALPGGKIVMGAGVRLGGKRGLFDQVRFAAVRGYHSAAHLGLEPEAAVCDPGFLVNRVWPQQTQTRARIGFVPHVYSEQYSSIATAAADAGLEVISPTLSVEAFLQRLATCARIYTESLHGAIFADTLRIPWARVCVLDPLRAQRSREFQMERYVLGARTARRTHRYACAGAAEAFLDEAARVHAPGASARGEAFRALTAASLR